MKKILIAVILFSSAISFADGIPPYVVIGNAERISGGNDAVYVSENSGADVDGSPLPDIAILSHRRSTRPIIRGNVPTAANSLLNPYDPVEVTAKSDTITLSDWGGDNVYSVRVFDEKGELIEVNSEEDSRKYPVTLNLSNQSQDFYVEIMQRDTSREDSETEFCYVLLRMRASGRDRAIKSRLGNPVEAISEIYRRYRQEAENNPY